MCPQMVQEGREGQMASSYTFIRSERAVSLSLTVTKSPRELQSFRGKGLLLWLAKLETIQLIQILSGTFFFFLSFTSKLSHLKNVEYCNH